MLSWEVTIDDVKQVLKEHGLDEGLADQIHDEIDFSEIEREILYYTSFDDQIECALSEIEDSIIDGEYLPVDTEKKFHCP